MGDPWDGSVEWRRPAEEGGGGKPPLECVQEFVRCLTRRQGAADDGKRPLRRLRVAVAKLKGGGFWGDGSSAFSAVWMTESALSARLELHPRAQAPMEGGLGETSGLGLGFTGTRQVCGS